MGMMGNEYIAYKLEGEGSRWTCVCMCVCVSDLMTHLWLRVTLGSGPLKEEPAAALATSGRV